MATQPRHHYTFGEYLELERTASYRSEFRAGEIHGMAGDTETHSLLSSRMIVLLTQKFPDCCVYDGNLRLYIEQYDESTYADAMVICGNRQFWNGQKDVVTNPTIVVEVLSPSTEKYDRTTKSGYYRSIPSLRYIVLVSQDSVSVELSTRLDGETWTSKRYSSLSDTLPLDLRVSEIYEGILE